MISAAATACPYCGDPTPTGKARRGRTLALLLGALLAAGFFGVGWYVNGGGFRWLTALEPIAKITCPSARAEREATTAFNRGPGQIRNLKLVALADVTKVSRTDDELRCNATGRFDDDVPRHVDYRFFVHDGQVSFEIYVP